MFKYEPPVDLTHEPWHSWEERGTLVYGNCRHCNAPYDDTVPDDQLHHAWCKWWIAYCDAIDNDTYEEQTDEYLSHD